MGSLSTISTNNLEVTITTILMAIVTISSTKITISLDNLIKPKDLIIKKQETEITDLLNQHLFVQTLYKSKTQVDYIIT